MSATGAGSTPRRLVHALRARTRRRSVHVLRARRAGARVRAPRGRLLLAAAVAVALLLAGWFWLRDSSLVAVRRVEVTGVGGPQATRIRLALEQAASSMTTLHVRRSALETAVASFSLVKRIEVETDFPHAMRIHVVTNVAVGAVVVDGRRIAVTSDGTLLRDVPARAALPRIPLAAAPTGERLTAPAAVAAVAALGAAPRALREHVEGVAPSTDAGLTIQLAHGPLLVFGDGGRLTAKWAAAAAVLADPEAAGATSIDVTAPERPAVAGLEGGAPATSESDVPTLPDGVESADAAGETDAASGADAAGAIADDTGDGAP